MMLAWNVLGSGIGGILASLIAIVIWEWLRRPSLVLELPTENDPSIQNLNDQTSRAFYHLFVRNKGKTPGYNCQITMRFIDARTKNQIFEVRGKWDRGPQPLLYAPVPKRVLPNGRIESSVHEFPHDFLVPFAEVLDVHPGIPEGFCIVVKYDGDAECYAFSTWSYLRGSGHRVPEWKLSLGEYHAIVELKYSGGKSIDKVVVKNQGPGINDVKITKYE